MVEEDGSDRDMGVTLEDLAFDFFIRTQYTAPGRAIAYFLERSLKSSARYATLLLSQEDQETKMPKYVIERDIPNVGDITADQIIAISQKSCGVLNNLGPKIQWVHSYVTQDKIYCIYIAPNEEMVREHARQGGFPANKVSEIRHTIDPTSSEA